VALQLKVGYDKKSDCRGLCTPELRANLNHEECAVSPTRRRDGTRDGPSRAPQARTGQETIVSRASKPGIIRKMKTKRGRITSLTQNTALQKTDEHQEEAKRLLSESLLRHMCQNCHGK